MLVVAISVSTAAVAIGAWRRMLRSIAKLQLPDRPYHTSVSGDGRRFAACSPSGKCRLFDNDLRQLDEIKLGARVDWVQLDEAGALLLVGRASHVDGYGTAGNIHRSFQLSIPGTSGQCCVFNTDERVLCVASWDKEPRISAWDLISGRRIAEAPLPVRGGAGYTLVGHPEGEAMAAVAFSGQSEEWMFWTHYARGRLRVYEQPEVEGVAFPRFHPTGCELVSSHESLGLCRVGFPSGDVIASVQPEQAFPDNPEDGFSYEIHFLDDDRLLVRQEDLSLYEFDLVTLECRRAVLTGADGMTFGEDGFFSGESWPLAEGRLLTSDCKYYRKFHMFDKRTDTLRLWDASMLFGQVSAPDPARPYTEQLLASRA
jgi:hypothetical protein